MDMLFSGIRSNIFMIFIKRRDVEKNFSSVFFRLLHTVDLLTLLECMLSTEGCCK